jgi:HEAT repeat protein
MLIGPPFIDPLLDLLADEENRVLRLYYLEILKGLGLTVKDPAIRRLSDRRWYFIRNLLLILRHLNDPSILSSIRGLFGHAHTRVRQEVLHTLLALGDPKADRILLNEMNSSDGDRCINAIILAGMTQNREVTHKLVEFLKRSGLGRTSFEIKKASVHALAEIGDTSILPTLQDVLKSFSLFFRRKSHLLKLEIIDSLGKYPAVEVAPILKSIARERPAVLASRALLVMKTLKVDKA